MTISNDVHYAHPRNDILFTDTPPEQDRVIRAWPQEMVDSNPCFKCSECNSRLVLSWHY